MSVVVCYRPENELIAYSLVALLRDKGIPAELRPYSNPWGVSWLEGNVWGEILVLEEDMEQAQEIIRKYLETLPEREPDNEDQGFDEGSMIEDGSGQVLEEEVLEEEALEEEASEEDQSTGN